MNLVTIDFETFWGKDYSLSLKRFNTSGYIRDAQFKAHCVGIKINKGKTKCYHGAAAIKKALDAIDWKNSALLAHNTAFDGAILHWHYGHVAAFYYDTLSMTRGLHNEVSRAKLDTIAKLYGIGAKSETYLAPTKDLHELPPEIMTGLKEGCIIDTDLCYEIFQKQKAVFPENELRLIDLTLRMFIQPQLRINRAIAEKALNEELTERLWLIQAAGVPEKSLTSNPKFAAELEKLGVEVPMKISKTTGKSTYAFSQTDEEFLELLDHEDRRVVRLAAGRLAAKSTLFETRGRRLIDDGAGTHNLPVLLNYYGAKCVPGDTEVLTRTGWIKISDWNAADPIAQVKAETRTIAFLPATKFIGETEQRWVSINAPYLRCNFTEGHTMPYLRHDSLAWATDQAGNMQTRSTWYAPTSGMLTDEGAITALQMRVLAMIQADGSYEEDKTVGRRMRLSLKKPRKVERALHLLLKAGIKFTIAHYDSTPGYTHYLIRAADYPVWMTPTRKLFGAWLLDSTAEAREALVDEISHWDGWVQGNQDHYSTSDRVNAEWVSTLCHLQGFSASVHEKNKTGRRTNYVVAIRRRGHCMIRARHVTTDHFYSTPYCATTETGFFLARSNGRIFITGNTGRWSGGNKTNMQNLPRLERDYQGVIVERGTGMLRLSIEAPTGYSITVADSAQIEARTLVWLAGQLDIVQLFAKGEDVYCHMASIIYGRKITKKDKLERFIGKIAVLGLGYGMGAQKFQTTLALGIMGPSVELSIGECKKIVAAFRAANIKVVAFWKIAEGILKDLAGGKSGSYEVDGHVVLEWEDETVWLPNGMPLNYPELRWNNGFSYSANSKRKKIYGGLLVENIVQALARIFVSDQMLDVADWLKTQKLKKNEVAQVVLMTHDEIVDVVPTRLAEKTTQYKVKAMRKRPVWAQTIPLDAEGGFALRYEK